MREELEKYLEAEPRARERRNKNRAIANLLLKKHNAEKGVSKDTMTDIVSDVLSVDRMWRKILEERPDLRGSDYGQKDQLEQQKKIELGYDIV